MIYYAGIGSRKTPWEICDMMQMLGMQLAELGLTLRSGRAVRADQFFEQGCDATNGRKEIFTPDHCRAEWIEHAAHFHPKWEKCEGYAQLAHGRNSAIMLGANLNAPVKFVVCWTEGGKIKGGTGQALRIAEAMKIPIFNFYQMQGLTGNYVMQFLRYVK